MSKSKKFLLFILTMIGALAAINHFESDLVTLKSDKFSIQIGAVSLSAYTLLKTLPSIALLICGSIYIAQLMQDRINQLKTKPSTKDLLIKVSSTLLYFITFLMTLNVIGIDITAFTVFGGAIFVGIGLGLQKIASNFIAGLFLLYEKAFEVGDILELSDGTTGTVKYTGARYTLIETFAGKDIIVPNEELFINRVTNWTHSHPRVRAEISIKVPYKYDIDQIKSLIEETALKSTNCLNDPKPICLIKDIDEGVTSYTLLCWIDVRRGFSLSESEIRVEVWKELKKSGIEIHLPQREVKISHVHNSASIIENK